MANHYVDTAADAGGDGTTSDLTGAHCAWDTIADVNGHSFSGDDFVYLRAGCTWNETLNIPSAGTLGHPITFTSYGSGAKPILNGAGLDYCVLVQSSRGYITLDGLEFADPDQYGVIHSYWPGGIEANIPNWIIQNCAFMHCGCQLFGPNTIVQDCTFHGPQPASLVNTGAICIRGLVAANCSALRNTIEGFSTRGIWFMVGADSPTVNDNIIHDIAQGAGAYGIDFDGYNKVITGTVTVLRNTVYNISTLWGILLENCSDGSIISNNLIYNCTDGGIAYLNYGAWSGHYPDQRGNNVGGQVSYNVIYGCNKGLYCENMGGVDFWNNVVDDGSGTAKGVGIAAPTDAGFATDYDIRNNIFGSGLTYVVSVPGTDWTTVVLDFDYNCVENITIMHEKGNSHTHNLATLQGLSRALNCFTTAPGFVDDAGHDYHLLSSSPCINTGVNVGLTEDFEGNPIT